MNKPLRTEIMTASPRISPDDTRALRDAMGQFATGVTVITAMTDAGPVGMTANSFASVSLDPALVLWSIDKNSNRYDVFSVAERYVINVLSQEQAALAMTFAKDGQAFTDDNSEIVDGVPQLRGALASFDCALHERHEGGDHVILVGRVLNLTLGSGAPLVFHQGTFGSFTRS